MKRLQEVVKYTGLSQPLFSHHLRTLKENQILEASRKGPFIYYRLKDKKLLDALGLFTEIVGSISDEKFIKPMFCCPPFWKMRMSKKLHNK